MPMTTYIRHLRRFAKARPRFFVLAVLAGSLASAASAYGASSLLSSNPPTTAPGIQGDVSAMRSLPPISTPSEAVAEVIRSTATAVGIDPDSALKSLRALLDNLGSTHSALYAFDGREGEVCFILWGRVGTCPQNGETFDHGIVWAVAGGYHTTVEGVSTDAPSAIVGIAADDVRSITLTSSEGDTPLAIVHNAFFHELPNVPAGTPWNVFLTIAYSDAPTRNIDIPDPRSNR